MIGAVSASIVNPPSRPYQARGGSTKSIASATASQGFAKSVSVRDETEPGPQAPEYSVRVSARAKRARLQVTLRGRVEVVVPARGFDARAVADFVARNEAWVRRALGRVAQYRAGHPHDGAGLPPAISLPALGRQWSVEYAPGNPGRVRAAGDTLRVAGGDEEAHRAALRRWLHDTAKAQLVPWLVRVSEELGLPFRGATVRCQKTRWGSCSSRGRINLNRNLLFLPGALVRHLFVHELCHTVHLNHSPAYWALVESLAPDYRRLERELRGASRCVPLWAYPD